ncbi:MAG: chaperone NapD [Magnetococcales bacterium]|nr:chaperone NapD [Magnetococcales bacterium]
MSDETTPFVLASALVQVQPERLDEVTSAISDLPGAEIHLVSDHGQVILTLEGSESGALMDTLTCIKYLDGVLSADLVYQHFEESSGLYSKEMVP